MFRLVRFRTTAPEPPQPRALDWSTARHPSGVTPKADSPGQSLVRCVQRNTLASTIPLPKSSGEWYAE
jgi:hypothetical protein